jgi:hypothetical protein
MLHEFDLEQMARITDLKLKGQGSLRLGWIPTSRAPMNNVSIRHGLLATLVIFGLMIVFGAALGVSQLSAASESAERIHLVSSRALLLNDAYKDMTRARSALTRAYSSAKAGGQVNADAIASAEKSIGKSRDELRPSRRRPRWSGRTPRRATTSSRLARRIWTW